MAPVVTQWFILSKDCSVLTNDFLDVAVSLFVDRPVHLGKRAIGLTPFTPANLNRSTLFTR
jgi:hypothetical protein